MSVIYILQNAGFQAFRIRLPAWRAGDLNSRNLHGARLQKHLWSMAAGRPSGPELHKHLPPDAQGSRQRVYSRPRHFCLLRTFSPVESLMATLAAQCQLQSWAPKGRNGERTRAWQGGRKLRETALSKSSVGFTLSGVILFSRWHHRRVCSLMLEFL